MKIYDTMSGKKKEFKPIEDGKVKMYACGVTVYDLCHIGHARQAIVYAMIADYLRYRGYDVTYVRNYTDVDDKIIKRANEQGKGALELSKEQIKEAEIDMENLHVKSADYNTKASEYIEKIIKFIEKLIEKGNAYKAENGDVYFAVRTFKEYGKLSHRNVDDMLNGVRIELEEGKRDPIDFALWKSAKPGEIYWESPWGKGRPGWHIECSVMAADTLGESIDIHGGGRDLQFPHHENEIAQSEALTGKPFAKYWMHSAYLNVNNQKMSKSLNNFLTARDALKAYDGDVIRFLMLSAHYRVQLNFSTELLDSAKASVERLYNAIDNLENLINEVTTEKMTEEEVKYLEKLNAYKERYIEKMDDDFNTADAITVLFDLVRDYNTNITIDSSKELCEKALELIRSLGAPLGMLQKQTKKESLEDEIERLIEQRQEARKNRDFALADKIRDDLKARGIVLIDTPQGVRWKKEN